MIGRGRAAVVLASLLASGCGAGERPDDTSAAEPGRTEEPGARLLVTAGGSDRVYPLDPREGTLLDSLPLDRRPGELDEPHGVEVAPDGRHWYATLAHGEPSLWKFESEGDRRVGRLTLPLPGAARIRLSPDGKTGWIPDYWRSGEGTESRIARISLDDLRLLDTPTVCPAPHDALPDPTGVRVAVTCSLSDEVVFLDPEGEERGRLFVGPEPGAPGMPRYRPMNAVWEAGGERVWVTLMGTGEVVSIRPETFDEDADTPMQAPTVESRLSVGRAPAQIDGVRGPQEGAFVANRGDDSVSRIVFGSEPGTARELWRTTFPDAPHPHGVAVSPDGTTGWVTYEGAVDGRGGVIALDLESGEPLWQTPVGTFTLGIARVPGAAGSARR